ncbi:2Fe-2S iron-sulfur cluster-binding protein [Shewanella corallii]|uniref:2Fe-2S iron-sulfur cluster-binding protein n=1 Tax=Shewanella corallii TaxID=560080 RepID=A0ABT0NAW9_9GAMM|nr:2Fe-2S iron-sulfur cluster-binding protein [Shewanella corallii]MCL2915497.1 2Fe-2S iron-sulfur cluster-binding protein [Shewanella corallii]
MSPIKIIDASGQCHELPRAGASNLMQLAVNHNIEGIDGECGGCCSCATCHVGLSQQDFERLPAMHEDEQALLEYVPNSTPTSRLACQLKLTDIPEGLNFNVIS